MAYELLTNRDLNAGFHVPFVYINDITNGLFIQLLLFAIWIIIAMGIYHNQQRTTGSGDIPVCMSVGGFITTITAILLRLIPNLLNKYDLGVVIILTVLSVAWLFFSKE